MSKCAICHSDTSEGYHFPVISVQTLKLREMKGERWVQALGEVEEHDVCKSCAKGRLQSSVNPGGRILKRSFPFLLLVCLGIVLTIFLWQEEVFTFRMIGPAAVVVGMIGIGASIRSEMEQKKALQADTKDALQQSAWLLLLEHLPKKNEDNDITYVPINQKTKGMQPKALALEYDLLLSNAKKATGVIRDYMQKS